MDAEASLPETEMDAQGVGNINPVAGAAEPFKRAASSPGTSSTSVAHERAADVDGLIAELRRQGFERIVCFPLRRDMPWLVGRKLDDCFYVAWHRKPSLKL